jgi:hypothetical protein
LSHRAAIIRVQPHLGQLVACLGMPKHSPLHSADSKESSRARTSAVLSQGPGCAARFRIVSGSNPALASSYNRAVVLEAGRKYPSSLPSSPRISVWSVNGLRQS